MLNIRINLTIDLKKVGAIMASAVLLFSQMLTPATALEAELIGKPEKVITVSLTHLKVQTTKSDARKALASPHSKYFDAEATAFLTVYAKDWTVKEWSCLRYIWTKESNFNPKAENKSSGAYGIAQFMPSTWGNYKVEKTPDARLQIKYGLRYILKRYGTESDPNGACTAKAFWLKNNWY
jgi:hypothetical protein